MRTHIDWLTFTMTMQYASSYPDETTLSEMYALAMESTWLGAFGKTLLASAFGGDWQKQEHSRAPYKDSWIMPDGGITLFASPVLSHCCVEISGAGCERLIALGCLNDVLTLVADRVTRIDIACDIETKTEPLAFVEKRSHKRMMTDGHQDSKTGKTRYVGAKTSDRYARVYRYNPPHPRSHLLRIEHVFRKEYAKSVTKAVLECGVGSVSVAAGKAFGWVHDDWQTQTSDSADISVVSVERNMGKTIYWLVASVAPAFKRLCANGTITNPQEFLERYFLADD